jgi:dipeptidase E
MKLLLTSGGFTNKKITNALLKLLEKPFKESKLVFIPTAANIESGGKEWLINDLYNCLKLGFAKIEIAEIASTSHNVWLPWIKEADIIMVGGGNTSYLMKQLKKSGLDKLLPVLLKKKIYVGISAGSMVAGKNLSLSSEAFLYNENTGQTMNYTSLKFISLCILPHLNSEWFPRVRTNFLKEFVKKISTTVYALDDNSAVLVDEDKISVVSEGKWEKFN